MSRITLYQRLKPEVKNKLKAEAENYSTSIQCIFDELKTKTRYNELTIDQVRTIHVFTNLYTHDLTTTQVLFGEHIFNTQ
tara:strand:- start:923 stop:1162 length:240 start_codon:yes stop_codon:yes gene_type:complete